MPRIAIAVTSPVTANAFLMGQISLLRGRGWDVHVITSPGRDLEKLSASGCFVHCVEMPRKVSPFRDARALLKTTGVLRSIKPDVLLASTPKASMLSLVAGRILNVDCRIYHVRGLRLETMAAFPAGIAAHLERLSVRCATAVVCDSASLLGRMRRMGILAPRQGVVLGCGSACGVDTSRFSPADCEGDSEDLPMKESAAMPLVVGYAGRLSRDKGVPELVEAVRRLRERGLRLTLALVGELEDPLVREVLKPHMHAGSWLEISGHTGEVDDFLRGLDIFCLPSHREGLPIALLEAMATGLPVVTSNATGCVDCVDDGIDGLVVPVGDVQRLSQAIRELAVSPAMRASLGGRARRRVQTDFEQVIVNERFVEFVVNEAQVADARSAWSSPARG